MLEMAAVVMTPSSGSSGRRGSSSGSGSGNRASYGSGGGTRASNDSGGVRPEVATDRRGAGNRGGGTSCAFQTPISCARHGNDGEENGWSFENIMGMMMGQQSGDREAREIEHRLRRDVQREVSHLAMEREASLCCKEMDLQHKENRVQRQMMSVMIMSLMQNNNAMSRMIVSTGGIGAHMGVPPEQKNVNAYTGVPSEQEGLNLGQSANGDVANREAN